MRTTIAVTALATALALTACGSDSDSEDRPARSVAPVASAPDSGGPGATELEAAVRAFSQALLAGDAGTAYPMLSTRCQRAVTRAQFTVTARTVNQAHGPHEITQFAVEAIAGSLARVTYLYANSSLDQQSEPWVVEGGQWRQDDC